MSSNSTSRPQVGLVGVSGYAQIYTDLLDDPQNASKCDLAAVVILPRDRHLEITREYQARGIRIYENFDSFIAAERDRLDICIIPTGIHLHARMTIAALKAGMNVLVEKPLAGSLADARAIMEVEQAARRWVAVGFQDIYTRTALWFKQQLVDGAIGKIKAVKLIGLWPRSAAYYARTDWAGRLTIDGISTLDSPLNNALAHFVNLALFFSGPGVGQSSRVRITDSELYRAHAIESFDTAVVKARGESGIDFWFGVSHACEAYREPDIILIGENGHASWQHQRDCSINVKGSDPLVRPVPGYELTRQNMLEEVLGKLVDPATRVCDSGVAVCHADLIQQLHDTGRIHDVNAQLIKMTRLPEHQNPIPAIRDINKLMDAAFEGALMLRELGFHSTSSPTASHHASV